MDCKLCNYYHEAGEPGAENQSAAKCDFTGVFFLGDVDNYDIEYPCRNADFGSYRQREKPVKTAASLFRLSNDDWRMIYLRGRAERVSRRA